MLPVAQMSLGEAGVKTESECDLGLFVLLSFRGLVPVKNLVGTAAPGGFRYGFPHVKPFLWRACGSAGWGATI